MTARKKAARKARGGKAVKKAAAEAVAESATSEPFLAGWRLVAKADEVEVDPTAITVDVIRPEDLVALSFRFTGCQLVSSADGPVVQPLPRSAARLTVALAFQHLTERAIYEAVAPRPVDLNPTAPPVNEPVAMGEGEAARHTLPEPNVLPARSSRLVFEVPGGESIPFSTSGLLAAIGRLPLVVHPLAAPVATLTPTLETVSGPVLVLPGAVVAVVGDEGPLLAKGPAALRRARSGSHPADDLLIAARDLRRTRAALSTHSALAVGRNAEVGPLAGVVGPVITGPRPRPRPRAIYSRPPEAGETALEAPFRLVISPSRFGGWAHATEPVRAADTPLHVELWHSRLGVRQELKDGSIHVEERANVQRKIRAVWARDRHSMPDWENVKVPPHVPFPFRMSLDGADRHMLVRQTAETWLGKSDAPLKPEPVDARKVWLSALGAWLDLHGDWDTGDYSAAGIASILSWDHEAPLGRDQYVRVVYPGFLFPFGFQAALVKLTERKMKDPSPSVAGLFQRKFLVIGKPLRAYPDRRDFPFTRVRIAPLVTPTLDDPGNAQNSFFWPRVGQEDFRFVLHCTDHEDRHIRLVAPLLWVAEHFTANAGARQQVENEYAGSPRRKVPANNQQIAFAPAFKGGDTSAEAATVSLAGTALEPPGTSTPRMTQASVRLPAVERISGVGHVPVSYAQPYKDSGFGGANAGEVWAATVTTAAQKELPNDEVAALPVVRFGEGAPSGSDKAGGFLAPDQPIRGVSRVAGTVGDVAGMAANTFDPEEFLKDALPKLFGIVSLLDLLQLVGGSAPQLVNEALDRVEGFIADLERAKSQAADAVAEANKLVNRVASKTAELQAEAQDALNRAQQAESAVTAAANQVRNVITGLVGKTEAEVAAALAAPFDALGDAVDLLEDVAPKLPPLISTQLTALSKVLKQVLAAADILEDVYRFVNGFAQGSVDVRFRFEWKPKLQSWPSPANPFLSITDPILEVHEDSLVLAVEGRASGKGEVGAEILAELKDFTLHLLPGTPLVRIPFDHLSFRAGTKGKPEVDVVIQEIEFVGILSFIETLKELIPFDGFADPPYLDVSPEGLTAGFTLGLPNVAVGVFSLANISLGADLQVPFLGKTVTVGFYFCTRERPFTLTVMMIGGGGFFGLRLSPDGLDLLELALEAGAALSIDLGVASGSVSIMVGIYMRLEGSAGSLTGYVRIRGEVDVLGLISASIELYLELRYEFDTGKMVGRATLTIEIRVLIFSGSVQLSVERKLAGSNGDPTFAEVMAVENGESEPWSEYCLAFAEE